MKLTHQRRSSPTGSVLLGCAVGSLFILTAATQDGTTAQQDRLRQGEHQLGQTSKAEEAFRMLEGSWKVEVRKVDSNTTPGSRPTIGNTGNTGNTAPANPNRIQDPATRDSNPTTTASSAQDVFMSGTATRVWTLNNTALLETVRGNTNSAMDSNQRTTANAANATFEAISIFSCDKQTGAIYHVAFDTEGGAPIVCEGTYDEATRTFRLHPAGNAMGYTSNTNQGSGSSTYDQDRQNQDRPNQDRLNQDRPNQDRLNQDRPNQNRLKQDYTAELRILSNDKHVLTLNKADATGQLERCEITYTRSGSIGRTGDNDRGTTTTPPAGTTTLSQTEKTAAIQKTLAEAFIANGGNAEDSRESAEKWADSITTEYAQRDLDDLQEALREAFEEAGVAEGRADAMLPTLTRKVREILDR